MSSFFDLPPRIVVADCEMTTWEGAFENGWSTPGQFREIIQFGGIIVETEGFTEIGFADVFVRPEFNPVLSDYCVDLTGITQEQVDSGMSFPKFMDFLSKWSANLDLYFFGGPVGGTRSLDRDAFTECFVLHKMRPDPISRSRFGEINPIFHEHGFTVKQSGRAPQVFGIDYAAPAHNALNDARGLVIALRALNELIRTT